MKIISFDNSKKGISKNAFLGFVFQFMIKFKGIIILPLIVHYLPKEVLGEWRLIGTSVAILVPVITLNALDGSGMFFSADTEKRRVRIKYYTLFHFTLALVTIFILISLIFVSKIKLYEKYTLGIIFYFLSLISIKLSIFLLQTYQKAKQLLVVNFFIQYGGVVLMLILISIGVRDIYTLLIPIAALNIVVSLVLFWKILQEIKYGLYLNKKFLKRILPVSIPLIPVFITEWVLSSIGIYLLQYYFSVEVVGSYSVLLSIASLLLTLRATLQFFWFSTCSNLIRSNKLTDFQSILTDTIKVYFIFSFLALIGYRFFAKDMVTILANYKFFNIVNPLYYMALGYIFLVFSSMWNGILYAQEKTKIILRNYLITAAIIVILSILLIKEFEIMGATIAYLIGNIVLFVTMFFSVKGIKFGFTLKEKKVNVFVFSIIFFITIFPITYFSQMTNRIIGLLLITASLLMFLLTKYIQIYRFINIIKLRK